MLNVSFLYVRKKGVAIDRLEEIENLNALHFHSLFTINQYSIIHIFITIQNSQNSSDILVLSGFHL